MRAVSQQPTHTMSDDKLKLYADFKVTAFDRDGEIVQEQTIEDTGHFTMEDISTNAMVHGVDEIKVEILSFETRRGDQTELVVGRND